MNNVLEAIGFIVPCAVVLLILLVAAYWACRAIDNRYRSRENRADYDHEREMLEFASDNEYALQRRLQDIGFEHNKRLIQSTTDRVKWLSRDLVKQINEGRVEMARTMMGEVVDMTTDMMKEFGEL